MRWIALRTYQTEIEADTYADALAACMDLPLSEFEVRECYVADAEGC